MGYLQLDMDWILLFPDGRYCVESPTSHAFVSADMCLEKPCAYDSDLASRGASWEGEGMARVWPPEVRI
jgi:hypothetical protein